MLLYCFLTPHHLVSQTPFQATNLTSYLWNLESVAYSPGADHVSRNQVGNWDKIYIYLYSWWSFFWLVFRTRKTTYILHILNITHPSTWYQIIARIRSSYTRYKTVRVLEKTFCTIKGKVCSVWVIFIISQKVQYKRQGWAKIVAKKMFRKDNQKGRSLLEDIVMRYSVQTWGSGTLVELSLVVEI